jgi:hypothetical protein
MRTTCTVITTIALIGTLASVSCGSKEKAGHKKRQPEGTLTLNIQAVSSADSFANANSSAAANSDAAPGSLALGLERLPRSSSALGPQIHLTDDFPIAETVAITAGPPDAFFITIASIQLIAASGDGKDNADDILDKPVTISVDSGTLDLSALLAATKNLRVPVGTYDEFQVSFKRKAKIKGCVTGVFNTYGDASGANVNGEETYCTRAGYSIFDAPLATNADFQFSTTPELMDFSLSPVEDGSGTDDTFPLSFPLADPLVVTEESAAELSLVFDLNRMLRYYNRNAINSGPNPGMPVDRTYFFTSLFDGSVYGFVGKPGRIYGYEMVFTSQNCDGVDNTEYNIGSWMTIITAADGSLITANLMPDDDNAMAICKGSTAGMATPVVAGSAAGTVNLSYLRGEYQGTLYGFTAALDAIAAGSEITGVTFTYPHGNGGGQCGSVRIRRGL